MIWLPVKNERTSPSARPPAGPPVIPTISPASLPDKAPATFDEYVSKVKELCGEMCDYTRKVTPGKILGTVSAKVLYQLNKNL